MIVGSILEDKDQIDLDLEEAVKDLKEPKKLSSSSRDMGKSSKKKT